MSHGRTAAAVVGVAVLLLLFGPYMWLAAPLLGR